MSAKKFRAADNHMLNALAVHYTHGELNLLFCTNAEEAGRFAEARNRWSRVRDRWPGIAQAWAGLAANDRRLDDVDSALATVREALPRFPADLPLAMEAGRLVPHCPIIADSVALWRAVMDAPIQNNDVDLMLAHIDNLLSSSAALTERIDGAEHPGRPHERSAGMIDRDRSILEIAMCALTRRFDDAFRAIEDLVGSHPDEPNFVYFLTDEAAGEIIIWATHARFRQPDVSRAVLKQMAARYSGNADLWSLYIETLVMVGRHDEAAASLEHQTARFPDYAGFALNSGFLAMKREEWSTALKHFSAFQSVHPEHAAVSDLISRTRMEQSLAAHASGAVTLAALRQDVGAEDDDAVRDLLLGFESLGCDCEFGLVQRRYGAEPIGLFRWNATSVRSLIGCLDTKLVGIGDPGNTKMSTFVDGEYYMSDQRWGFGFHTFTTEHEVQADKLFAKMCRRMSYLRDKLLSDLQGAQKIFVFKDWALDVAILRTLHASLRAYGPCRLLWVTTVDAASASMRAEARPAGLYQMDEGLWVGAVSRFGNQLDQWDISFSEWVTMCRRVSDPGQADALITRFRVL